MPKAAAVFLFVVAGVAVLAAVLRDDDAPPALANKVVRDAGRDVALDVARDVEEELPPSSFTKAELDELQKHIDASGEKEAHAKAQEERDKERQRQQFIVDFRNDLDAAIFAFNQARDLDAYEATACVCQPEQASPELLRNLRRRVPAINRWVRTSTTWPGRKQWLMPR